MENIARSIIRASFSQESPPWCDPFAFLKFTPQTNPDLAFQGYRLVIGLGQGMTYIPKKSKVVYRSKDWKSKKTFDALEWLAAMPACACPHADRCSHAPNKGEQMVRYYGYYCNVSRGSRKKSDQDGLVPCILQPEESSKAYLKNWARFTRLWRAYPENLRGRPPDLPQACPVADPEFSRREPVEGCHWPMRVISFIEDQDVIKKILQRRTSPQTPWTMGHQAPSPTPRQAKANALYTGSWIDYSDSQEAPSDNGLYHLTFF